MAIAAMAMATLVLTTTSAEAVKILFVGDSVGPTFGADGAVTGRMEPARPGEDHPVRSGALAGERRAYGFEFSVDDLVRLGSFFLPVHERARVPDDGHPMPK